MAGKIVQTAGRDKLGMFAPDFARYNDDILFGQVWNDDTIDLKTKSTIVISVFMGRGLVDSSLKFHLMTAKKNGITKTEIAAIITQAAFYAGWPVAWAVFNIAKEIWTDDEPVLTAKDKFQKEIMFPIGEPNEAYAKYFIGQSYLAPLTNEQVTIHNVTFEPGCRNNWHIHHADKGGGQMLVCVGGYGWYQEEGKAAQSLKPGDVINILTGVKHWHGAQKDNWFAHLSVAVPGENTSNEWLEPVTDEEYSKLG
ncbi:MAG: carboxymuconolactone decarboxylase family protein [Anaerovoracaceae bacterium]|nr:carboxymuconolactone decarboxylase family protein [Bacillota bacterium]MDY2670444.1 carboxymuconolactone decarboxylase family protein [Anaerovoracaceae bacterium]